MNTALATRGKLLKQLYYLLLQQLVTLISRLIVISIEGGLEGEKLFPTIG